MITGASMGIGRELAQLFASEGHSLVLVARRQILLENLASELKAKYSNIQVHIIAEDLGLPGAGKKLFDKISSLQLSVDFLVNNAGFGNQGEFRELPLSKELQMIDLNVRTLVELTHLYLPGMLDRKFGRILNIGSTAGFQPGPYMATYYATKAYVNSFSEALGEELKGTGVTCSVLAPGPVATEFAKVAGVSDSLLFQVTVANANTVARAGYNGMMNGHSMILPGLLPKMMVSLLRITPRFLARKIAGALNRTKIKNN